MAMAVHLHFVPRPRTGSSGGSQARGPECHWLAGRGRPPPGAAPGANKPAGQRGRVYAWPRRRRDGGGRKGCAGCGQRGSAVCRASRLPWEGAHGTGWSPTEVWPSFFSFLISHFSKPKRMCRGFNPGPSKRSFPSPCDWWPVPPSSKLDCREGAAGLRLPRGGRVAVGGAGREGQRGRGHVRDPRRDVAGQRRPAGGPVRAGSSGKCV